MGGNNNSSLTPSITSGPVPTGYNPYNYEITELIALSLSVLLT